MGSRFLIEKKNLSLCLIQYTKALHCLAFQWPIHTYTCMYQSISIKYKLLWARTQVLVQHNLDIICWAENLQIKFQTR